MDEYIKRGNVYKPTGVKGQHEAKNDVKRLSRENSILKNRCRTFTGGLLCESCTIKCELRNKEICTN